MEFKEIKTWVISSDHKATPKNPFEENSYEEIYGPYNDNTDVLCYQDWAIEQEENMAEFEKFATEHVYHCSPSLVAGEYPAEIFGHVTCQWFNNRDTYSGHWCNADPLDSHLSFEEYTNKYSNFNTRQYLQLKQVVGETMVDGLRDYIKEVGIEQVQTEFKEIQTKFPASLPESKEVESVPVKSAEEILIEVIKQAIGHDGRVAALYNFTEVKKIATAYASQFKKPTENSKVSSVFAITNLDAEDLGGSILRTYYTRDEAYEELEDIEGGVHPDFICGGALDVFEIKLPEAVQVTNPIEVIKKRLNELERIIGGDSEYDERSHSRLDEANHILKLIQ